MGYIYKITNDINDKIYVGQTINTLEQRFYKHCWEAKQDCRNTSPLHLAIKKYGKEHFTISLLEECANDQLDAREIYWIKYYNSYSCDGYNATIGGKGNQKFDENEIISLWSLGYNQQEIAERLSCERHTIKKYLDSSGISEQTRLKKRAGNATKPVQQIDPKSKEIVAEYASATIAANITNSSSSGISLVCRGKRKTHNGYIWKYKN